MDFFGAVDVTNASIQFRVSTFNGSGVMGRLMSSQWYTDKQLAGGNYIQMAIAEEVIFRFVCNYVLLANRCEQCFVELSDVERRASGGSGFFQVVQNLLMFASALL